jgi:hypothetical protein
MKMTPEYAEGRKIYKRKMTKLKKKLPSNWVQIILSKKKRLSISKHLKMYNDLVNIVNGKSYRKFLNDKHLVNELYELSETYNHHNNESKSI